MPRSLILSATMTFIDSVASMENSAPMDDAE
jgi:hypothetical protein